MTDTATTAAAATPAAEEATDLAALAELTAQRSAVYRLLARLYRVEVDEEFLAELKAMRFPAATGNTAVDAGYRAIATYLSGADAHAITDLAVDYVRAFIGHGVDALLGRLPLRVGVHEPQAPHDAGGPRRGAGGLPQRGPGQAAPAGRSPRITSRWNWNSWPCSATAS